MAFWEGSFQMMDPLTLSTIIQLQLEDSEQFAANVKGKQREGTLSNAQFALQTYTKDLPSTYAVLSDRRMVHSFAMAVIRDSPVIRQEHQREDQIVRDREMARALNDDAPTPLEINPVTKNVLLDEQNSWNDAELLSKVAAIYMLEPGSSGSTPPALVGDDKPKLGHCVACCEDVEFYQVAMSVASRSSL
ncbi:hypothetical protein LTR22_026130 [Elasticomyces elasticus]|nr:hypothetical protein LTR22_026130 [Elasticomyces elasticus]